MDQNLGQGKTQTVTHTLMVGSAPFARRWVQHII